MTDIDTHWAWSRVEAMADSSLAAADRQRMSAAMRADPELAAAVARARVLRAGLRRLRTAPVPAGLCARLLRLPDASPGAAGGPARSGARRPTPSSAAAEARVAGGGPPWPSLRSMLSWGSAAACAGLLVAALLAVAPPRPAPTDARSAALKEFGLAMTYLEQSSDVAREQVRQTIESGLREALEATRRKALGPTGTEQENGG